MSASVAVAIVTWNSARFIRRALQYVFAQEYPDLEIIVVDNASMDETPAILFEFENRVRVIRNPGNVGFAEGQNQAIRGSSSDWVLTLNPDVRLEPDFIRRMLEAGGVNPEIGSVSGKLLRMAPDFEIPVTPVIDSTGIYFTGSLRHFDRGSQQPDTGQYEQSEYVFGVTGAAALYRRRMIEDISIGGEFFDSDFFSYREDADVAWRAQLLGWKCVYTPRAVAYHVRSVLPQNRRLLPPVVNMHSVKNRFLMRIKNVTVDVYLRHFIAITLRDCVVIAGCFLREFTSLAAFPFVIRNLGRTWAKRREIMRRRRATSAYLAARFEAQQVASR